MARRKKKVLDEVFDAAKADMAAHAAEYVHVQIVPRGWQCPVCRRVNAPHVQFCGGDHSEGWTTTTTVSGTTW